VENQIPTHILVTDPLRLPLQQAISVHTGRPWKLSQLTDLQDLSSHPAALLSDGDYSVFAKFSDAANGLEQFEVELAGLRLLTERSGVLTPTPIGNIPVEGGAILVLEAVQAVDRGPLQWRQIGQALARIHQVKWDRCGLETQGYFGPMYQDNRPMSSWAAFFAERRLWPRLIGAIDSGNLPSPIIRDLEKLIQRLPDLCGPEPVPTLLHGDAQQNNYISTASGAVVIDPAVCFGNPEFDLAYIDYFQPVPEDVLDGYREEMPIDPGFSERRDLWRIYGYLAIVTLEGSSFLGRLSDAVQKYL
jgi:protein-ribulosamine 3-kinase